ncbi:hypothetical protein AZE42_05980 [Rhizopogon vesiculosus]|uniref:Protein kinase domain-containing protein n=1 Tax=Rhizopogon vesiculosus TaxID=180088 RepID=A0A1J8QIT9_9AGAM|nr:hypothetical protein AZE42_05980 [Rhizopogon vesiculosus]
MLDEVVESGPFYGSRLGAVRWAAPELMVTRSFSIRFPTSKSDVWSFGCNMIHVLSGQEPWSALTSDMDVSPFVFPPTMLLFDQQIILLQIRF